jgi:hypothetical protein
MADVMIEDEGAVRIVTMNRPKNATHSIWR